MAATLVTVMAELKRINQTIDKGFKGSDKQLKNIDKRIAKLEKDMAKVLECVSTENAAEFPSIKRRQSGFGQRAPIAAKSR